MVGPHIPSIHLKPIKGRYPYTLNTFGTYPGDGLEKFTKSITESGYLGWLLARLGTTQRGMLGFHS